MRTYSFERNIALHMLLGGICALQPRFAIVWVLYIIFYEGAYKVFRSRNVYGQAHLTAAYMVSMEMISRMSRSGLPHELTKYAVIFILLNGLLARPRFQGKSALMILYFLLQIPSILLLIDESGLERARQLVSFNLAGPLCLTVAVVYFYRRPIHIEDLSAIFQRMLLPMAATITWLFISTPGIAELKFQYGANFAASGYGPNQMASVLGAGILLIGIAFLFRVPLFQWKPMALILLALLAYRGLLTFSRGGIAIPLLILSGMVVYFTLNSRAFRAQFGRILAIGGVLVLLGLSVYTFINQRTGNELYNRYAGISYGKQVGAARYTSGRLDILRIDGKIFLDYPIFGIGPGAGTELRVEYGYWEKVAAHIEFSRLPAEHGVLGIAALGILLFFPLWEFKQRKGLNQRFLLIAGVLFCFGFMSHSATRIALPMFLYGLGFAYIISAPKSDTVPR
jgi:hypothetical protein